MTKVIRITECEECPHIYRSHYKGGGGDILLRTCSARSQADVPEGQQVRIPGYVGNLALLPVEGKAPPPNWCPLETESSRTVNRQPFYHRCDGLLFTATREVDVVDFVNNLMSCSWLDELGILPDSIEIEEDFRVQPGDPSDLM